MPARALSGVAIEPAAETSARAIAQALLEGFDKHYALFRECARAAKRHFEDGDFLAISHLARERIDFYDRRVAETAERVEREFTGATGTSADAVWARVKLHYIGLLIEHRQPECAETFFNSVSCKILHRTYYHNRFIFVRPAVSTEYLDADPPTYRSYYPRRHGLRAALIDIVLDFGLKRRFADFRRDLRNLLAAFRRRYPRPFEAAQSLQIQVLNSLFFRNRTAYIVGRVINGLLVQPFAVPLQHDAAGRLRVDALLTDATELALLFSANRAYFLVDMEVPSAYVDFLTSVVPDKTPSELYTMVGLQKHGKNLFYRDFLHHLRHSTDRFIVAPGIKGLVMAVFTLPSYPYVFKVIKDRIAVSKDTDRRRVQEKYALVKHHDRVGRMTDILEYSDVAFPRERFSAELLAELEHEAPSQVERVGDRIVIRHVYIERRLTPLNLYLQKADAWERARALREYGDAIAQLARANIFAGDLLFKNFGVTRFGRVVFYDYDELTTVTSCRFRSIPKPRDDEDEWASEPTYYVGENDVFPEEFLRFLGLPER
ncbi:MAG TPA: bifunctional isocitrate dehydrogenase kinase/phosphatase, partial [Casimicrobiaceae bacterium]